MAGDCLTELVVGAMLRSDECANEFNDLSPTLNIINLPTCKDKVL